jgi:hypothetical protein
MILKRAYIKHINSTVMHSIFRGMHFLITCYASTNNILFQQPKTAIKRASPQVFAVCKPFKGGQNGFLSI